MGTKGIGMDFYVPNTKVGRNFIKLARIYLNRKKWNKMDARTRGPRDVGPNTQATQEQATHQAIYLRESPEFKADLAGVVQREVRWVGQREIREVSEKYETLLTEYRTEVRDLREFQQDQHKELGGMKKEIFVWQMATLSAAVLFTIIGYFING